MAGEDRDRAFKRAIDMWRKRADGRALEDAVEGGNQNRKRALLLHTE